MYDEGCFYSSFTVLRGTLRGAPVHMKWEPSIRRGASIATQDEVSLAFWAEYVRFASE
jgi:hypothetical protein